MSEMISIEVANAERIATLAFADVMMPPPPVDYVRWAEENIVFSKRESQFEGPYNRNLFGYFDEVLRALSPDDPCRVVTLMKSAQLGGTDIEILCASGDGIHSEMHRIGELIPHGFGPANLADAD